MASAAASRPIRTGAAIPLGVGAAVLACGLGLVLVTVLLGAGAGGGAAGAPCESIVLSGPGGGARVGATEYGGPGDPASGTVGASGASLVTHPDSYAELGGVTFQTATALGGLPYMTALRVTWDGHSAVAFKRDFGLGGGPVAGLPRVIDLWWRFAGALRIPYESGRWSGAVRVSRPAAGGAGAVLGLTAASVVPGTGGTDGGAGGGVGGAGGGAGACTAGGGAGVPITAGPRAELLASGQAAAPAGAPAAVRGIIAAGNQIVGRPYVLGGGHGLPLSRIAPAYDCSSSIEHLLYGARLLPVSFGAASGALESFGLPGPGRWVTIYASADHVFMYVAGLRWDTHDAAGPQDGSGGIGWHPLVREAAGFVVRHPVGL